MNTPTILPKKIEDLRQVGTFTSLPSWQAFGRISEFFSQSRLRLGRYHPLEPPMPTTKSGKRTGTS
jgi:hypothetical protein